MPPLWLSFPKKLFDYKNLVRILNLHIFAFCKLDSNATKVIDIHFHSKHVHWISANEKILEISLHLPKLLSKVVSSFFKHIVDNYLFIKCISFINFVILFLVSK